MLSDRLAKIESAITAIRSFHEIGKKLPSKTAHKDRYGQHVIDIEAEKFGINPDTIRKARQFADPKSGYTTKELENLCRSIHKVQSKQDGSIFGRTHVIRLLTVRKEFRDEVQDLAIENGWSIADLESYIASQFGSRRDGGRKPQVPSSILGVLVQLEGLCEHWRRWAESVTTAEGSDPVRRIRTGVKLPPKLLESVIVATEAIEQLHDAVNRELQTRRPNREVRKRFRIEEESE